MKKIMLVIMVLLILYFAPFFLLGFLFRLAWIAFDAGSKNGLNFFMWVTEKRK